MYQHPRSELLAVMRVLAGPAPSGTAASKYVPIDQD